MSINRYARTPILDLGAQYGTGRAREAIQSAISKNQIQITKTIVLRGRERLDTLAGEIYGDGRLWWILAAASNIGWGLQVPAGTIINVVSIEQIAAIVG